MRWWVNHFKIEFSKYQLMAAYNEGQTPDSITKFGWSVKIRSIVKVDFQICDSVYVLTAKELSDQLMHQDLNLKKKNLSNLKKKNCHN